MYTVVFVCSITETPKDIIDHFYHYMSHELDVDFIVQHMSAEQLLNDDSLSTIEMAADKYQKNCLILNAVRLMDVALLMSFCDMLLSTDHQRHIGAALTNGKLMDSLMQ